MIRTRPKGCWTVVVDGSRRCADHKFRWMFDVVYRQVIKTVFRVMLWRSQDEKHCSQTVYREASLMGKTVLCPGRVFVTHRHPSTTTAAEVAATSSEPEASENSARNEAYACDSSFSYHFSLRGQQLQCRSWQHGESKRAAMVYTLSQS